MTKPPVNRKFRLGLKHGIAIGPGKAALLECIQETGSISAAGRMMSMSYRRAWLLVSSMNKHFREPLVIAVTGGPGGGGAKLTPAGDEALRLYRLMEKKAMKAIETELRALEEQLSPDTGDDE